MNLGIASVQEVAFHEESGGRILCVIQMKNASTPQVWQALYGASAATIRYNKIMIVVDDDIDPRDMERARQICEEEGLPLLQPKLP